MSAHGIAAPRRLSAPRRPSSVQPRSSQRREPRAGEVGLGQVAVDEAHGAQVRVLEVGLAQDAALEDDLLDPRGGERREVDAAVAQHDVAQRALGPQQAGHAATARARHARIEPPRASTLARLTCRARRRRRRGRSSRRAAEVDPRQRDLARSAARWPRARPPRRRRAAPGDHESPFSTALGASRARRLELVGQPGRLGGDRSAGVRGTTRDREPPRAANARRLRDPALRIDPIAEARRHWEARWEAEPVAARWRRSRRSCAPSRSCMARLNDLLRPHGLTFPRYEALMLLSSRARARCRWARSASASRSTARR